LVLQTWGVSICGFYNELRIILKNNKIFTAAARRQRIFNFADLAHGALLIILTLSLRRGGKHAFSLAFTLHFLPVY
jgi:hypothetical protein